MNQAELMMLAQQYMVAQAAIVVVVLLIIGTYLKKTPLVKDWAIPWCLIGLGIIFACGVLQEITIKASIQGILAAFIATGSHQLWKQTNKKDQSNGR